MIINFASKTAKDIFDGLLSRHARKVPIDSHDKTRRLFDQLNAAYELWDLRAPPSNHLKALKGSLSGKWSIRINNQWRVIFDWSDGNASNVDIVDYH
jgi:proteic killer suppression protein